MAGWLVKSDPETYGARDLERDGTTTWDGVANPTAQRHLRSMKFGDPVLVYHTGDEKAIVALAHVASAPRPDANDKQRRLAVVDLAFGRWLDRPVTLREVKQDSAFANFDLVRLSRLSVMPVAQPYWERLLSMAGKPA